MAILGRLWLFWADYGNFGADYGYFGHFERTETRNHQSTRGVQDETSGGLSLTSPIGPPAPEPPAKGRGQKAGGLGGGGGERPGQTADTHHVA